MASVRETPSLDDMRDLNFQQSHFQQIQSLWHQQQLCDVHIKACDRGDLIGAHRIILASSSGFFRAMFCGAGQSMREGAAASNRVVELPYSQHQVSALLAMLYEHNIRVCSSNVTWLLDMASYLEVQPLLDACCSFLRAALSPDTCVDVMLLAHHYHATALQAEGVLYLAQHLSTLLLLPEARQGLLRLPPLLLQQLLSCEALEVEQEAELLCLVSDWVSAAPQERLPHLHQLLSHLQLSLLPREAPLSQQQLQACTSPAAADLAQQLHRAALECECQQQQQQQQQCSGLSGDSQYLQKFKQEEDKARSAVPASGSCGTAHFATTSSRDHTNSSASTAGAGCSSSSSSSSSECWQQGRAASSSTDFWVDINNHTSGSSNSSLTCTAAGSAPAAPDSAAGAAVLPDGPVGMLAASATTSASVPDWLALPSGAAGGRGIGAVVLEAWPGRQRGYQPTRLLVAGGHDLSWRGLKAVELYDPRTDTWSPGPTLPAALPFAGAGMLGRSELYVVGGGMYSSLLARLDVAGGCWHSCEGPRTPRLHAAVTGSAGLLYVAGGRSQVNQVVASVEVYDPADSRWRSLPDMQQPRYAHAVASLAGRVFALGGQATKAIHSSVEAFEPGRGTWEALPAQLGTERKYCAAAALGGRLLVLGGMNEARSRLSSMEGYDPREGRWTSLASMQHARSSCGVAALGGRLYAVGGNAGDQQLHAAVEEFDPAAGRWRDCCAISCGRSGLLAAAV